MDSPTLLNYNFDQFWEQEQKQSAFFNFNFNQSMPLMFFPAQSSSPNSDSPSQFQELSSHSLSPRNSPNTSFISHTTCTSPITPLNDSITPLNESLESEFKLELTAVPTSPRTDNPKKKAQTAKYNKKAEAKSKGKANAKEKEKEKAKEEKKYEVTQDYKATKNVAKNFGKATIAFILADIAIPYLHPILEKYGLSYKGFCSTMKEARSGMNSVEAFKNMACIYEEDSERVAKEKKAFVEIAIVFIKHFSINWIMNSKLNEKIVYLKSRFKLIRRLQNPEQFCYMRTTLKNRVRKIKVAKAK